MAHQTHTHARIDRTMSNVDLNKTVKTAIIYVRIRDRLESKLDHFVAVSVSHNLTIFQSNEKSGARVRMLGSESLGQHRENDKQEEKRSLQRMSRRRSRKVKTGALVQNYTHTRSRRGSRRNGETKNNRKSYLVDGLLRACWLFYFYFERYSNFNFNMHRIYLYISADGTTLCHCACRHLTVAKRIERATETDRPHNTTKSKAKKNMIRRYI